MANRIPLIVDSSSKRIRELPSGDTLDLTGNSISAVRNIFPEADSLYDLGSATLQWRDLYLSGNSIQLGGLTISRSGNSLQLSVDGATSSLPIVNGLTFATLTGTEALTNKTLTSPTINGGTVTDLSSITTTGNGTIGGNLIVTGDLTVNGATTTISTTNLVIEDKNIELAVGSTTDVESDGGGITLKGATDKTITYNSTENVWETNIGLFVNGVLKPTSLGFTSGVPISEFSSDGTLLGNANDAVPTESAVKTYVDSQASETLTLTNKTLGATTIAGNLLPDVTEVHDLGSSTNRFRDLYLKNSSIFLGDAKVMVKEGRLTMNTDVENNYDVTADELMPNITTTQSIATSTAAAFAIAFGA